MDTLRKKRDFHMAGIDETFAEVEEELRKDKPDLVLLASVLSVLRDDEAKINEVNDGIRDQLLEDPSLKAEDLRKESKMMRDFSRKMSDVQAKIMSILEKASKGPGSEHGSTQSSPSGYSKKIKLPTVKLRKFSGELKDWLGWYAQIQPIDEDDNVPETMKFSFLIQGLEEGSRADALVKAYPQCKENYKKAIGALKERYGNPKLLKQVYVRELISLVMGRTSNEKRPLSSLYDSLETQLRSLETLEVTVDQMGVFLFPMVESCLPEDILLAWQRSSNYGVDGSNLDPPKSELNFLMEFLKKEIDNEEQRKLARCGFDSVEKRKEAKKSKHTEEEGVPTAAGLFNGSKISPCIFCDRSGHASTACYKAKKMTVEQKVQKVKEKQACFACLGLGHRSSSKQCKPPQSKCPLCDKRHHMSICPLSNKGGGEAQKEEVTVTQTNLNCSSQVILRTLMVRLVNPVTGKFKKVRMLLDCGSMRSYIKKKTAEYLELIPVNKVTMTHEVFGGGRVESVSHSRFDLKIGNVSRSFSMDVRVLDNDQICGYIPRAPSGRWMAELKRHGIFLSDLGEENPSEIEFLLGADLLGSIITGNMRRLKVGLTATETRLGWAVMGELSQQREQNLAMTVISMTVTSARVEDLWSLDSLGIKDPIEVSTQQEKDDLAQQHFVETVKQNASGRYSVSLPWIIGGVPIPSNKEVAYQRLEATTRKLQTMGKFQDYFGVFEQWESEGIISKVPSESGNGLCHYLPHRAVIKPESKTTPIRPVFDASCKVGRAPSLNGCLEKGPNLIELIPSILLRFRMGQFGVTSDIRKAFQMIEVNQEDRDFQRFLWWEDSQQKKLVVYQHNRVVFGMNCSPFLLAAVLNFHLDQLENHFPDTVKKLKRSLYVDNSVLALETLEDYEKFKDESTHIMKMAGMDLREWERSGEEELEPSCVLGVKWNKVEDCLFIVPLPAQLPLKVTKRLILSQVHQIFDPLGLLCPVVLVPKLLIQKAWEENKKWDEEVSSAVKVEFTDWFTDMIPLFDRFSVPRRCTRGSLGNLGQFQLHVFSDASKDAYAAAVFLRTEIDGKVEVQLLQAKARVGPVKKATIPRLELLGCSIAARLLKSVRSALEMVGVPTWFWSDSSTALTWIKSNDDWGTFVGNRVREILELTEVSQWNFVPGVLNPADLPSRGVSPKKFLSLKWWEGPDWLKKPPEDWPSQVFDMDPEAINEERKKGVIVSLFSSEERPWYMPRNSYLFNVRCFALVCRFVEKIKKKSHRKGELDREEIASAERHLFGLVQRESLPVDDKVIAGFKVIKDQDGLIRVKSKITNRQDTPDFKCPVLLPHDHPLVDALIREEHEKNCHGGAQVLMGLLREKVWVAKGRLAIKKVLRACVTCQRFTSRRIEVPVAPLPEARVKDATAFQATGIDLAGPLILKDTTKRWIVLFSCAIFRAVHLELVSAASSEEFILAFIRFCRRKRRPEIVYTDNGTNFLGAVNDWREQIDWEEVKQRTNQFRIDWRFNPPSAPWWGGFWERMIRSLKDLLKRMFGFGKLDHQSLETCLCEAEWVLNHRPLTYVTEDAEDMVPITPAFFLHDLPQEEDLPEGQVLTVVGMRKNLKKLMEELRARFRKEYLGLLVERGKQKNSKQLQEGDLVFIGREDVKRVLWPMGRIVELIPGPDGVCRVAKVRIKTGILTRPLQRLYPLEVGSDFPMEAGLDRKPVEPEDQNVETVEVPLETKPIGKKVKKGNEVPVSLPSGSVQPIKTRSGRQVKPKKPFEN